jgi:hypothetical protein
LHNGSLGSDVEHFGIGVIIPLHHTEGILPNLKTCIIETRKLRKLSTFAVFVDFKKAKFIV